MFFSSENQEAKMPPEQWEHLAQNFAKTILYKGT